MKQLVTGLAGLAVAATTVVLLLGSASGDQADPAAGRAQTLAPRVTCTARRVGQDVEVAVRLRLTDRELAVTRDEALVVADLGDVTQTRVLRPDTRRGTGYSVVFEDLPEVALSSISVRASRSPDDPASFACASSAVAGPRSLDRPGSLPRSGG